VTHSDLAYLESVNKKIFDPPEDLVPHLDRLRQQGKTIVFGNGCFELLHVGHIRYLFAAKALGDILVVGVNTDESVKINKPDRTPVNPDHERREIIASLEAVDFVVPLREQTPIELLEILRPDIHTKGTDYKAEDLPEASVVEAYGGRVAIVGDPKDHSVTDMLDGMK
jgi:rfaE bifunctional protein nucleotidyltransferase chain/domain